MYFTELPAIEHDLVQLRPIMINDRASWYAYLRMPVVYENTSWDLQSVDDLMGYVWNGDQNAPSAQVRFAIASHDNGQLVGTVGFHTVSALNRSAELAYDLHPHFWGKGIASAVSSALLTWAHAHAGMIRVQATVLESNEKSIKVLERCGFQREGLLRSFRLVRGVPGNFWMYSHVVPLASLHPLL